MAVAMGAVAMGDRVPPQRAADRSRSLRGRYRSLRARRRVSSARDRGGYGAVEAQIDEYRTRKTRWGRERGARSSLPASSVPERQAGNIGTKTSAERGELRAREPEVPKAVERN